MKVLVTGGAGFIGSHLVDAYLDEGWEVFALDDLSSGKRDHLNPKARFVELDVCDREGAEALFAQEKFDLVNHHAAQISVRESVANPGFDARTNVLGLLNLLEAGRAHGVGKVVYVSSGGVIYGDPDPAALPVPETAPKQPLCPYGVTKLAGEHYLHYYRHVHSLKYVALRYSNVYGPRQDPHGEAGVVAIFSNLFLEGKTPPIFGDGEQTRDFVYIEDVVRANLSASERMDDLNAAAGSELDALGINIGTGEETTINTLYRVLSEVAGHPHPADHAPPRSGELHRIALDIGKANRVLGFEPEMGLEQGLAETFRWVKSSHVG